LPATVIRLDGRAGREARSVSVTGVQMAGNGNVNISGTHFLHFSVLFSTRRDGG